MVTGSSPHSPLPDGTDTLIATSTNTAGATAPATATAIIDTTPPATPTVTISEHGTPDGVINASELVNGKVEATVKLDAADLAKNGSATIVVNDGGHATTLVVHADGSVTGTDASVSASYSNGTVTLDIAKPADGSTVTVTATQSDGVNTGTGHGRGHPACHPADRHHHRGQRHRRQHPQYSVSSLATWSPSPVRWVAMPSWATR
jgi:hypothetical protein